jgi:glycerol-3-phosphate dehydrogenase
VKVAVVGAGINGVMTAWALARRGHEVTLFERGEPIGETSSASTKLLHGGLRYLETGHVSLVREGLAERAWWIDRAPQFAHKLELLLPIRRGEGRPRWMIKTGLVLYDQLSGKRALGRHRWLRRAQVVQRLPGLRGEGLLGAYAFWDGQMDDLELGRWALWQAIEAGVDLHSHCPVASVGEQGDLRTAAGESLLFDAICNVGGPWAESLLAASGLRTRQHLRLVRGSHILIDGDLPCGMLVQAPSDNRVCFILPYLGQVMVGTTEVEHAPGEPIACSDAERDYLVDTWNAYFERRIGAADVRRSFAGVRPLLAQPGDPNANTREHAIERHGRVITVFGGKWTTARVLGEQLADAVERLG